MLLETVTSTSARVAATSKRKTKTTLLAACLEQARTGPDGARSSEQTDDARAGGSAARPSDALLCSAYLSGQVLQERLGVGYAALRDLSQVVGASEPQLHLSDVHDTLVAVTTCAGVGSKKRRSELLGGLFARATEEEQQFLIKLILGELRQGALQGLLLDAVSQVTSVPVAALRRALLLSGDVTLVAARALLEGEAGLRDFRLHLFRPLAPMLAQPADDLESVLDLSPHLQAEYKLDGARIQVHKQGDQVRVFSRLLNEVTAALPEVVALTRKLSAHTAVLDGEAIAMRSDGRPQPFQVTMRRFGRKNDVSELATELPLTCFFFDCLHVEQRDLFDAPYAERIAVLGSVVPEHLRVPRKQITTKAELDAYLLRALAAGHEGLLLKDERALYEPGRRGSSWLKLKPVHTLDLVVLAAEWGSGRRQGTLSNLHLGARTADGFVMLGKTFKGLTDELLAFQTHELLQRQTRRDGHVVHVRPELVVEIAFDGVQISSQYPGGVALRFARVKRYRPDKTAAQADTLEQVRAHLPSDDGEASV